MEGIYEARGLQPQSHPQGARTPDWPAQPTTKPRAPRARPPTGTRHTQARWLEKRRKKTAEKRGWDREETPRTAKLL